MGSGCACVDYKGRWVASSLAQPWWQAGDSAGWCMVWPACDAWGSRPWGVAWVAVVGDWSVGGAKRRSSAEVGWQGAVNEVGQNGEDEEERGSPS